MVGDFDPTYRAEDVAQFLQEAYNKLPYPFNGKNLARRAQGIPEETNV